MKTGEHVTLAVGIALLLLGLGPRARAGEAREAADPASDGSPTRRPTPAGAGPGYMPQTAPPPPEPLATEVTTVHRVRSLPLGVGLAVLGTSYGVKLLGSALLLLGTVDGPCDRCRQEAGQLLVPIAGPLLVAKAEDPHGHSPMGWAVVTTWSVAEAAAITLTIIGLVGHDVRVERARQPAPSVTVVPAVARGLGVLSLNAAW
jgi:hypothetical protein